MYYRLPLAITAGPLESRGLTTTRYGLLLPPDWVQTNGGSVPLASGSPLISYRGPWVAAAAGSLPTLTV